MISASEAYRAAVSADTRRTVVRVETDVTDPDSELLGIAGSAEAEVSVPEQLFDNHDRISRYATLERNYWLLDGRMDIYGDDYERNEISEKIGYVSEAISDSNGEFSRVQVIEMAFSYTGLLQVASIYFSDYVEDGVPSDFSVSVWAGDVEVYTWSKSGNKAQETQGDGFEAYHPDRIVLTVTKWSLPGRRLRLRQILPGFRLIWTGDDIASLVVEQNTDPSCVTLPYGTAKLSVDNSGRVFEPRNKEGYFRSIQARQLVEIYLGLYVGDGVEYRSIGRFYQHSGGWSSSDNGLSIDWDLVDIIGLLGDKEYVLPDDTPVTLSEWVASIVAHLGGKFATRYHVDDAYKDVVVSVPKKKAVRGKKLADLIRYLGLATGTWPRADAETGFLTFEPLWDQGVRMTLHNMNRYPVMSENDDVGLVTVTKPEIIDDETKEVIEEEKNTFGGTNLAASRSVNIESPFIIDDEDVARIFRQVITQCGGNAYDITWRGDPCAECGDVVTLELDEQHGTSARLVEQSFDYSSGVLANCKAKLIQPQGYWTYANGRVFTEDTTWTVPDGVHSVFAILVGGGQAGDDGDDGDFIQDGFDGWDGKGGMVFADGISVSPGQDYAIKIGAGSTGFYQDPEPSSFGDYTSANGKYYNPSYTDIRGGMAYGRFAVKNPLPNTGDGGKGGKGGKKGKMHKGTSKDDFGYVTETEVVDEKPGKGEKGSPGASGCVVLYWN